MNPKVYLLLEYRELSNWKHIPWSLPVGCDWSDSAEGLLLADFHVPFEEGYRYGTFGFDDNFYAPCICEDSETWIVLKGGRVQYSCWDYSTISWHVFDSEEDVPIDEVILIPRIGTAPIDLSNAVKATFGDRWRHYPFDYWNTIYFNDLVNLNTDQNLKICFQVDPRIRKKYGAQEIIERAWAIDQEFSPSIDSTIPLYKRSETFYAELPFSKLCNAV